MKKDLLFVMRLLTLIVLLPLISNRIDAQITFSNSGQSLGYVGGGQGQWVAVTGDINGDGKPDAIAAAWPGPIDIHINTGGGVMASSQLPNPSGSGVWSGLVLADIDKDGDLDLIGGIENSTNGGLYFYKNNGVGVFTPAFQASLIGTNKTVNWVSAADVDGDGDMDLLVSNRYSITGGTKILLNDGTGNFSSGFVFPSSSSVGNVMLDIDGDGDKDVLIGYSSVTDIYKNNGSGSFTLSQTIAGNKPSTKQYDLDGDGDLDLVIGENNRVFIHKNNGAGTFSLFQTLPVTNLQVWGHVGVGDLDGDGDKDIYVPSLGTTDPDIVFANNGKGGFCKVSVPSINTGQADDARLEDFNGDGKLDVYVTNLATEGDVIWFNTTTSPYVSPVTTASSNSPVSVGGTINLSSTGTFTSRNWTGPNGFTSTLANPQITNAGIVASGVYTVNALDGSGCIATATTNVIVSDHPAPVIVCPNNITVNNTPGQNGATVTFAATETTPGTAVATFTYSIQPGSFFPVGTTTVTATATNDIGSTSCTFTVTVIKVRSNSFIKNPSIQFGGQTINDPKLADVDGDGDLDVFANQEGAPYGVAYYKNDGAGNFGAANVIPGINDANFYLGDLDGDGDVDIIVPTNWTSKTYGKVFLNDGAGNFTAMPGSFISMNAYYPLAKVVDINKDGLSDIVYSGIRMPDGAWNTEIWLNTGTVGHPNFAFAQTIVNYTPTGNSLAVADIDGDGDLDMVSGGNSWPALVYVNNGGTFADPYEVSGYSSSVFLIDWDNDGDKDLLRYDAYNNSGLYLHRNDGHGNFEANGTLLFNGTQTGFALDNNERFELADVDKDGFLDAVLTNGANGTRVLLNKGCSFVLQPYILGKPPVNNGVTGLAVGDVDNDGFPDVITTFGGNDAGVYLNDLLQVTAVPLSNITSTTGATVCGSGGVTLNAVASNNGTINWYDAPTGGASLATGSSYSPLITVTTTYYVDATNSNGCVSARVPVIATIAQTPVATITLQGSATICPGGSVILTASEGAVYLWSNGASSNSITVNEAGNYSVKITSAEGCTAKSDPVSITIGDAINPTVITKNISKTITTASGAYTVSVADIDNGSYDNCSIASRSLSGQTTFDCSTPSGIYSVTLIVTDISGNISSAPATVTITNACNRSPVANCNPLIVNTAPGICSATLTAEQIGAGSTDPDNDILTYSISPAGPFATGVHTVTLTVTDPGGLSSSCTTTITVKDNQAPVPTITTLPTLSAQCSVTATAPTAMDNCAGLITATTTDPVTYSAVGTYTINWNYKDGNGNTSYQTQTVVVLNDVTAPVPVITVLPTLTGDCSVTAVAPQANDNCSGIITATTLDPVTYTIQGTFTITWKYTDAAGNYTLQTQKVIVKDVTAPVPVVADLPIITGECFAVVSTKPKAMDACTGLKTAITTDPLSYNAQGTYTIHWVYTDNYGNKSYQNQTVIVKDVTAPVPVVSTLPTLTAQCSVIIVSGNHNEDGEDEENEGDIDEHDQDMDHESSDDNEISNIHHYRSPFALDNCKGWVKATTSDPLIYSVPGTYTIHWIYDDGNGNVSSQDQTVIVKDISKPSISNVPNKIVNCGASTDPSVTGTPVVSDNCSAVTISSSDVTNGNIITRTWKATDASGNFSTSVQLITMGSLFNATVSSVPTNNTYTGGGATNLYLGYGAQSTVLQAGNLPSNGAPYSYVWTGANTNRLNSTTSASPVFTPNAAGYYTFTVTVTNKYNCKSTATISICVTDIRVTGTGGSKVNICHNGQTLQVSVNAVSSHLSNHGADRLGTCDQAPCNTIVSLSSTPVITSITKQAEATAVSTEEELKVTVMPNPSTTHFTLKLESKYETPISMRVMDVNGRVVDAKSNIGANSTIQIGHNYGSGTYYAELIQSNKRKVVQLIKVKG